MESLIQDKLNALWAAQQMLDDNQRAEEGMIATVMTDEIKQKIADVRAEFAPNIQKLSADIAVFQEEIKREVLAHGRSVSGDSLTAVYSKGRVSWETAKLEGFIVAHPELAVLRKVGEPSVSIRAKNGIGMKGRGHGDIQ